MGTWKSPRKPVHAEIAEETLKKGSFRFGTILARGTKNSSARSARVQAKKRGCVISVKKGAASKTGAAESN